MRTSTFYREPLFRYQGNAPAIAIDFIMNWPVVTGSIGTASGKFLLDTGAEGDVQLAAGFVAEHHLVDKLDAHQLAYNGRGYAGPGPEAYLARSSSLRLGPLALPSLVVRLDTDAFDASTLAGSFGQSVLDRFDEVFDCMRGTVYFEPTSRSTESQVFNRAGLVLDDLGKGLQIMTVLPNSPATRAGLREGDIVQAIDGLKPDGDAQPAFLQPAGTKVHLRVVHGNNDTREIDLTLETIL